MDRAIGETDGTIARVEPRVLGSIAMRQPERPAVSLRPASLHDRRRAYEWLAASDATLEMMGPPRFPDHPIPTWGEFCADYADRFFQPEGDGFGRLFIVCAGERNIGCISYDGLDGWRGIAELDIWIGSSADWSQGWGSAAIRELSGRLLSHPTVECLIIRPSRRNSRAIAAYRKAGFTLYDPASHDLPASMLSTGLDYADAVVLVHSRAARPNPA